MKCLTSSLHSASPVKFLPVFHPGRFFFLYSHSQAMDSVDYEYAVDHIVNGPIIAFLTVSCSQLKFLYKRYDFLTQKNLFKELVLESVPCLTVSLVISSLVSCNVTEEICKLT